MKRGDIEAEIDAVIALQQATGGSLAKDWIINAVVSQHDDIEGQDADWYVVVAHVGVANLVRFRLRAGKLNPRRDDAQQLSLPGCQHLQRLYLLPRAGVQTAVAIDEFSWHDFDTKIEELQRTMIGCQEHIDELRRFRDELYPDGPGAGEALDERG